MSGWFDPESRLARYKDQLEKGQHDHRCEQRERSFICHCRKRRRVARGLTTVPAEDLYFPPPSCPSCGADVHHDGDGWRCDPCSLSWNSAGDAWSAEFIDEYGELDGEQFGCRMAEVIRKGGTR